MEGVLARPRGGSSVRCGAGRFLPSYRCSVLSGPWMLGLATLCIQRMGCTMPLSWEQLGEVSPAPEHHIIILLCSEVGKRVAAAPHHTLDATDVQVACQGSLMLWPAQQ